MSYLGVFVAKLVPKRLFAYYVVTVTGDDAHSDKFLNIVVVIMDAIIFGGPAEQSAQVECLEWNVFLFDFVEDSLFVNQVYDIVQSVDICFFLKFRTYH